MDEKHRAAARVRSVQRIKRSVTKAVNNNDEKTLNNFAEFIQEAFEAKSILEHKGYEMAVVTPSLLNMAQQVPSFEENQQ